MSGTPTDCRDSADIRPPRIKRCTGSHRFEGDRFAIMPVYPAINHRRCAGIDGAAGLGHDRRLRALEERRDDRVFPPSAFGDAVFDDRVDGALGCVVAVVVNPGGTSTQLPTADHDDFVRSVRAAHRRHLRTPG